MLLFYKQNQKSKISKLTLNSKSDRKIDLHYVDFSVETGQTEIHYSAFTEKEKEKITNPKTVS